MSKCVVKYCSKSTERKTNLKEYNISYHRLPTEPKVADQWIKKIRLNRNDESWKPTPSSRICSIHFSDDDIYLTNNGLRKLCQNAIPTKNLHIYCTEKENQIIATSLELPQLHQSQKVSLNKIHEIVECKTPTSDDSDEGHVNAPSTPQDDDKSLDDELEEVFDTPRQAQLRSQVRKKTLLQAKHTKVIGALREQYRHLNRRNAHLKTILAQLKHERFPMKPRKAARWIKKIRLNRNESWKPIQSSRICSSHFSDDDISLTKYGERKLCHNDVPTTGQKESLDKNPEKVACKTTTSKNNCDGHLTAHSTLRGDDKSLDVNLEEIFDIQRQEQLRRQIRRKTLLEAKHTKLIRALRGQYRHLARKNAHLKTILAQLKHERCNNGILGVADQEKGS